MLEDYRVRNERRTLLVVRILGRKIMERRLLEYLRKEKFGQNNLANKDLEENNFKG